MESFEEILFRNLIDGKPKFEDDECLLARGQMNRYRNEIISIIQNFAGLPMKQKSRDKNVHTKHRPILERVAQRYLATYNNRVNQRDIGLLKKKLKLSVLKDVGCDLISEELKKGEKEEEIAHKYGVSKSCLRKYLSDHKNSENAKKNPQNQEDKKIQGQKEREIVSDNDLVVANFEEDFLMGKKKICLKRKEERKFESEHLMRSSEIAMHKLSLIESQRNEILSYQNEIKHLNYKLIEKDEIIEELKEKLKRQEDEAFLAVCLKHYKASA